MKLPACTSRTTLALLAFLLAGLAVVGAVSVTGCGDQETGRSTSTAMSSTSTSPTTSLLGADAAKTAFPVTVVDDNGIRVTVSKAPQRIVSTAPTNTEILFALGAGPRVVGVSSLDDYPPEVARLNKVGDFQTNTEAVVALSPDLILGHSGSEDALKPLVQAGVPVLVLNPSSLEGIYKDITMVGAAVGAAEAAEKLNTSIKEEIDRLRRKAAEAGDPPKVFYALDNTLWTAGPGSFVDELLRLAGATNVASKGPKPWFQYTPEQLLAADPDLILLPGTVYQSPDNFAKDPRFVNLRAVKQGRVQVIDDVTVTRFGPRIAKGLEILIKAVHPSL